MTERVLSYASAGHFRELRHAGIILLLWACVQVFLGLVVGGYGLLLAIAAFLPRNEVPPDFLLIAGILLFIPGASLAAWGISTLKSGVALMRGKPQNLRAHIVLTTIAEIAAHAGVILYIVVCVHDHVWKNYQNLIYAITGFPFYLLLPVSLALTRTALRRASICVFSDAHPAPCGAGD